MNLYILLVWFSDLFVRKLRRTYRFSKGERGVDTPHNECVVGQGPHGARIVGRIVGARSAKQSVIDF